MKSIVRIGTRGSKLARAQAEIVAKSLSVWGVPAIEIVVIHTRGDERAGAEPSEGIIFGNFKKSFVEEIENELLSHNIDAAVHSLKDLPNSLPAGLKLGAVLKRDEARDALVSRSNFKLRDLPRGSRIGTSSLRRKAQLLAIRSDFTVKDFHGNVDTRLRKLDAGEVDAIVLSAAGLIRLEKQARISEILSEDVMLPAIGQGAIAIEIRDGDIETEKLVEHLDDVNTHTAVMAERAFAVTLGGDCNLPIAAYAKRKSNQLVLTGLLARTDGSKLLKQSASDPGNNPEGLGRRLAELMLADGGAEIIKESA